VLCVPVGLQAGPREALWHALIRQNYGATHFILGRDHAGPGANSKGVDFYGPYDARDFALRHQSELRARLLPFEMMVYVPGHKTYYPAHQIPAGEKSQNLSGTEVRRRLANGTDIPEWFSWPDVVSILRRAHPPRSRQGFCIFLTGLSGSGKTSLANALLERLMEETDRRVTVLDGDWVRSLLSSELGFSVEHRHLNVRRTGYAHSLDRTLL
jgi:sulfate adenylyltransferase